MFCCLSLFLLCMFFFFSIFCLYVMLFFFFCFFFSSRRRHTRCLSDWSSDVCSSDLTRAVPAASMRARRQAGTARVDCRPFPFVCRRSFRGRPPLGPIGSRTSGHLRDRKSVV